MSSNLYCEPPLRTAADPGPTSLALAQWLAHELRNPLAPIATAAELLRSHARDEQARQLGSIIEGHAQQLRRLIDELVDRASVSQGWQGPLAEAMGPGRDAAWQLPLLFEAGAQPGGELDASDRAAAAARILVVDDNADAAALLGQWLQSLGHEVRVSTDPHAALALAASFEPHVGLLDIAMPGMDGHELARHLLQLLLEVDLRLAAVTAYSQPSDRQTAKRAGFEQYFVKPLDVLALRDWLARLGPHACTRATDSLNAAAL